MQCHFMSTPIPVTSTSSLMRQNNKLHSFNFIESLILKVSMSFMQQDDTADPGIDHVFSFLFWVTPLF